MSSGDKLLQINPLERALSTDIMRLQFFAGSDTSELLRAKYDTGVGTDDVDAGGLYSPSLTPSTPPTGEVITGILFQPTGGANTSVITSGIVCLFDPDSTPNPDDSPYKKIYDSGTSGIVLSPNSSGSTRIDVIECSRLQPDTVLETDNRDVFNPSSGNFSTVTVNKVTAAQLQYRIRSGTPGSGYPAAVAEWLPLYVVSVPTGATTWDPCTIWDVRPMAEDDEAPQGAMTVPRSSDDDYVLVDSTTGTSSLMTGLVDKRLLRRRVGGELRRGTPGSDSAASVDLNDAANQDPNFTYSTGAMFTAWCVTPFGLPRWARFTDGPAGRQPRSPRGIVVVSRIGPSVYGQIGSFGMQLPSSTGLGATVVNSALASELVTGIIHSSSQLESVVKIGRRTWFPLSNSSAIVGISVTNTQASPTPLGGAFKGTIIGGTHCPKNARMVRVRISCAIEAGADNSVLSSIYTGLVLEINGSSTTNPFRIEGDSETIYVDTSGTTPTGTPVVFERWIPFSWLFPSLGVASLLVSWIPDGQLRVGPSVDFLSGPVCQVVGWEQ